MSAYAAYCFAGTRLNTNNVRVTAKCKCAVGSFVDSINAALVTTELKSLILASSGLTLAQLQDENLAKQADLLQRPTNPLLATDVRLNNLDDAISSCMSAASYTAPDNANIVAIASKLPSNNAKIAGEGTTAKNLDQVATDLSAVTTGLTNIYAKVEPLNYTAGNVNAVVDKTGYSLTVSPPTALEIVQAVDSSTVLAKETTVLTRLANADYVAPDNAAIADLPTLTEIENSTTLAKETSVQTVKNLVIAGL